MRLLSTLFLRSNTILPRFSRLLLGWLWLVGTALSVQALPTAYPGKLPPLASVLRADGTLRPGTTGSFDAHVYSLQRATGTGQLTFHPAAPLGNGDEKWQDAQGATNVLTLAVASNGDVYVGGSFQGIGGVNAAHVARWNGTGWSSLGTGSSNGVDGNVFSLALAPNGDLYVGGVFAQAGTVPANGVAKWNGTGWSSLGTGANNGLTAINSSSPSARPVAQALALAGNGDLYVGGGFSRAGTVAANNIVRWDGTSWNSLGTGPDNGLTSHVQGVVAGVFSLVATGSAGVYMGGSFTQAGGITTSGAVKWTGTAWSTLGTAFNAFGRVACLALASNGELYAGGQFNQAGSRAADGVAKWNGTSWSSLGTGPTNYVYCLSLAANGDLYAGGLFTTLGGASARNIARWNGTSWNPLGTGLNNWVYALGSRPGTARPLVAGGAFTAVGDESKTIAYFGTYADAVLATAAPASAAALLVQVHPNPARGLVQVVLPVGASGHPALLRLRDELGRVVRTRPIMTFVAGQPEEFTLEGVAPGLYLLEAQWGETLLTHRLLVE